MSRPTEPPQEPCPPDDWLLPGSTRPRCCARHQGQYDAYRRAMQGHEPCLLCHQVQDVRGIFIPTDPILWGGNLSQHRLIFYSLCLECFAREECDALVETRLYTRVMGLPS